MDFLLLAESGLKGDRILEALNQPGKPYYWPIYAQPNDLAVFSTQPPRAIVEFEIPKLDSTDRIRKTSSHALYFRIKEPANLFNLVLVHLRSQLRGKPIDWMEGIRDVNARIQLFEGKSGDSRTIVVGDLNINPFDEELVAASGFHAMMTRRLATGQGRFVGGRSRPFFYNPMWSRFGCEEATGRPPGSYYYDKAEHLRHYWNIFDQVLVRPCLLEHFKDQDLELVDQVGGTPLRKNGIPDATNFSDHLPILFKLGF